MPIKYADQVVARPLRWLWPEILPSGKLALLDGDPDMGKSLIALDLCARLSTGAAFPDGRPSPGPANSLVLSAEDNAADTIVPRLRQLGADIKRIAVWEHERDDEDWPWHFPSDVWKLEAALAQTDARLAVIEPIMAFLDRSIFSGSDQSVRRALTPLIRVADKHCCTLLLQRHLNKQGGGRALYRGLSSIAFVAACRYAMLVGRDPSAAERFVLAPVRHSLTAPPASLSYQIRAAVGGLPALDWLGSSPVTADQLVSGAARFGPSSRAAAFLVNCLAAGPVQRAPDLAGRPESRPEQAHPAARQQGAGHPQQAHPSRRPAPRLLVPGRPGAAPGPEFRLSGAG